MIAIVRTAPAVVEQPVRTELITADTISTPTEIRTSSNRHQAAQVPT